MSGPHREHDRVEVMRLRRSDAPSPAAVAGAASLQIPRRGGDRDHPIPIHRFSRQGGDRNHPLSVEGEEEEDRGSLSGMSRYGGDRNLAISVEDNHDDVLLQIAIAESLRYRPSPSIIDLESSEGVKQEISGPKGKRPIKEISFIDLDSFETLEYDPDEQRGARTSGFARRLSKRRCLEENSVTDVGESSAAPPTEAKVYCSICMEEKFDFERFRMRSCSHLYCTSCVSQYVSAKVEENEVLIGCPDPGCKTGFIELDMCQSILPRKVIDQWGSRLCEKILEPMRLYCPYKDCSALLIHERGINGEVIRESECPHCYRLFCARCKAPWHSEITCEAYQQLGEDEKGGEDLMLMKMAESQHWQRCPKCKFYVERIDGCNYMRCRCGKTFCYRCAGPMNRDHNCLKCRS